MTEGNTTSRLTKPWISGAVLPPFGFVGQVFLHTPPGRSILYEFDGTNWDPIISLGAMTIYVDLTGVNDLNYGSASGSSAFRTVAYAVSVIPPIYGGSVVINVGSGTFSETVSVSGKNAGGSQYTIIVNGTQTQTASLIATGGAYTIGSLPTITTSGGLTAHAYQNLYLVFDPATTTALLRNVVRIVDDNDTSTITLAGDLPAAPVAGDVFKIYSWATNINAFAIGYGQKLVTLQKLSITNSTSGLHGVQTSAQAFCQVIGCSIVVSGASAYGIYPGSQTAITLTSSYINASGTGAYGLVVQSSAYIQPSQSKIVCNKTACFDLEQAALSQMTSCLFDGVSKAVTYGIFMTNGAQLKLFNNNYVRNCTTALRIQVQSATLNATVPYIFYSGNTTTSSVDATTFGVLG